MDVGKLFKTTVVIWTDYDPQRLELSALAREAEVGDAYCSKQECGVIEIPEQDADWDGTDFFGGGADEEQEVA